MYLVDRRAALRRIAALGLSPFAIATLAAAADPGLVLGAYAEHQFEDAPAALDGKRHPADWDRGAVYPVTTVVASTADRRIICSKTATWSPRGGSPPRASATGWAPMFSSSAGRMRFDRGLGLSVTAISSGAGTGRATYRHGRHDAVRRLHLPIRLFPCSTRGACR